MYEVPDELLHEFTPLPTILREQYYTSQKGT